MARPRMAEKKKRVAMSISVSPVVSAMAEKAEGGKSHFMETSVQIAQAVATAYRRYQKNEISVEDFMERAEDAADIWEAEFDEGVEAEAAFRLMRK